jgi:hypothetical protein
MPDSCVGILLRSCYALYASPTAWQQYLHTYQQDPEGSDNLIFLSVISFFCPDEKNYNG